MNSSAIFMKINNLIKNTTLEYRSICYNSLQL